MLAGFTWDKVKCPSCHQVNDLPVEKVKISEWERILEMKHIKVTCPTCKKTIYTQRESEYVTCSGCNSIISIVKEVPLRPQTIYHKFSESVLIPKEEDFKHEVELPPPTLTISNEAKFKHLFQTVYSNEYKILKDNTTYYK